MYVWHNTHARSIRARTNKNTYYKCLGKLKYQNTQNYETRNLFRKLLTMCFLLDLLVNFQWEKMTRKSAVPAREQVRLITCQPRKRNYINVNWVGTIRNLDTTEIRVNSDQQTNDQKPLHYLPGWQSLDCTLGSPCKQGEENLGNRGANHYPNCGWHPD